MWGTFMNNRVTPCPDRGGLDGKGRVVLGGPQVDVVALPELVARSVVPMSYLYMREDFDARFFGCSSPGDVNDVLRSEGYWPRPENEEWREGYDKRCRAARERVRRRRTRAE